MQLIHNDITYDIQQGATIHRSLANLETYTAILNGVDESLFHVYDIITLVDTTLNLSKNYLVGTINGKVIDNKNLTRQTTLTLVEPTKYLEKIILPTQSFTHDGDTMLDVVNKLLRNAKYSTDKTSIITLTDSMATALSSVTARYYYFTKPNLREALDTILDDIHARVVADISSDYQFSLSIYIKEKSSSSVDLLHLGSETTSANLDDLNGALEISVDNAIPDDEQSIFHGWDMLKSLDGSTLTSSNAGFLLEYPIEYVTKFQILAPAYKTSENTTDETVSQTVHRVPIDLSEYIVPKELYDIKTSDEKNYLIYYTRGERTIGPQSAKCFFVIDTTALTNIIRYVFTNYTEYYPEGYYFNSSKMNAPTWNTLIYRLDYIPFINMVASVSKSNNEGNYLSLLATSTDAPSDKQADVENIGSLSECKLDANGNGRMIREYILLGFNSLPSYLLKTSGDYTVTDEEISFFNISTNASENGARIRLTFDKNWKYTPNYAGVDKQRMFYQISLDSMPATVIYKTYLYGSHDKVTNNTVLYEQSRANVVRAITTREWADNYNSHKPSGAFVLGDSSQTQLYYIGCTHYRTGNNMVFNYQFLDNYSVAYGIGKSILGGKEVAYNPYVDESTGESDSLTTRFTTDWMRTLDLDSDTDKIKQLPKAPDVIDTNWLITKPITLDYYKDRYIALGLTYEIEPRDNDTIWWGSGLAKHSPLLSSLTNTCHLVTAQNVLSSKPRTLVHSNDLQVLNDLSTSYVYTDNVSETTTVTAKEYVSTNLYSLTLENGDSYYATTIVANNVSVGDTFDKMCDGMIKFTSGTLSFYTMFLPRGISMDTGSITLTTSDSIGSWGLVDDNGEVIVWNNSSDTTIYFNFTDYLKEVK